MKTFSFTIALFAVQSILSQTPTLLFDYDEAGNQIKRRFVMLRSRSNEQNAVSQMDLKPFFDGDELKYWPNPVDGLLHLQWVNDEAKYCKSLILYNNQGQQVFFKAVINTEDLTTIDFSSFATGIYFITLTYSNEEQKQIKIIKQ